MLADFVHAHFLIKAQRVRIRFKLESFVVSLFCNLSRVEK